MPKEDDSQKGVSQSSMCSESNRGFEIMGQDSGSDTWDQDKREKRTESQTDTDDEDTETAGGREGNFSDKERDGENQWSPGSTQSSDR